MLAPSTLSIKLAQCARSGRPVRRDSLRETVVASRSRAAACNGATCVSGRGRHVHRRPVASSHEVHLANRSTERILTTHTGSLPRPDDLRAPLATLDRGEPVDRDEFDGAVRSAVDAVVARQRDAGIATAAQAALVDSRIVYAKRAVSLREPSSSAASCGTD